MNKEEFEKLLSELHEELKRSVHETKEQLSHTKSLYDQINNYVESSKEFVDKFINQDKELSAKLVSADGLLTDITTIKTNADTHLQSITDNLSSIKSHIDEMDAAYTNFTTINSKITDSNTGLEAILASASATQTQINELKTNADTHLQSITDNLSSIKSHIDEMDAAYTNFTTINSKITDSNTGLEAILTQSESVKGEIIATSKTSETLFKEIGRLRDIASEYAARIKALMNSAEQSLESINKHHKESEELKKKIFNILNISSQKAHANYFNGRQKILGYTSIAWLIFFVLMLGLTIYSANIYILPLVNIIGTGSDSTIKSITIEAFIIRLGIVAPALFTSFYCLNQFSKERRLHEQYAFKAISMLSIESSVELLRRTLEKCKNTDDRDNQIIMFAIKTLEGIYKDPIDSSKQSFFFKGGNDMLEITAEIKESIGELRSDVDKLAKIKEQEK